MPIRIRVAEHIKTKELRENIAGGDCQQQTLVSYYHQKDKLVFVFDCDEVSPVVFGTKDNDKLYKGDIVELMITLGASEKYLEVGVNPDNLKYAAIVANPEGTGKELSIERLEHHPIETELVTTEGGYIAKIVIPIDWLKELGWTREAAKINFYRQDFTADGELRLYAFSPTRSANFHKIDSFVPMEILD
ncbi:MAG: hypothetical protein PHI19_00470 [Clostridia bacterium]|nr:hypothetical protein [Clostridia bacterium]